MVDPTVPTAAASLLGTIASQGILGLLLALTVVWLFFKDRQLQQERVARDAELKAERDARIQDAKSYTDMALKLQNQVIEAVHKLATVFDEVKKMMQERRPGGRPL